MTQPTSSILEKSIRIMDTLARSASPLRVSTIVNETHYNRSSVHRVLSILISLNVVQHDEVTGEYDIGSVMLSWAYSLINKTDLRAIADPIMRELSAMSSENALLAIRDHLEVVYINRVESSESIRVVARVGSRAPLHCTALGKCLVAFLDDHLRERVLAGLSWTKYTDNTTTERAVFEQEIVTIRRNGYAIDNQEHQRVVHCLAAPIWNAENKVTAAISITAPVFRVHRKKLLGWADPIRMAAEEISAKLGTQEKQHEAND